MYKRQELFSRKLSPAIFCICLGSLNRLISCLLYTSGRDRKTHAVYFLCLKPQSYQIYACLLYTSKINPGTDKSSSWGPGLGLVFPGKTIKINLRPGNNEIGFYDGEQENRISGLEAGKPVWLRMELQNNKLLASLSLIHI